MRLINTNSLELEEFMGYRGQYAILSHTWGEGEVTLQQYREWRIAHSWHFTQSNGTIPDSETATVIPTLLGCVQGDECLPTSEKTHHRGMLKILRCAQRALIDGYKYIWVDTCCIDKTSSAELQEAINSMFRWYKEAKVCYAYLSDIDKSMDGHSDLRSSRWFSRGWTLQELLAPREILFLDTNWEELGRKTQLLDVLEQTTGIDRAYLRSGSANLGDASIATRMSWVANRQTTRKEDMAYCLLGIFGIHMPMLYGEGDGAFQRLQLEIMKTSGDCSIMAWDYSGTWVPASQDYVQSFDEGAHDLHTYSGLLATSPVQYAKCQHVVKSKTKSYDTATSFNMSQDGLEIVARISIDPIQPRIFYVALGCWLFDNLGSNILVLPLTAFDEQVDVNVGVLAIRKRWMTPMAVRQRLTHRWQVAKIRIVPDVQRRHLMDKLSLSFNCHFFDPEWDLVGMYPPGPDILSIQRGKVESGVRRSKVLCKCPWEVHLTAVRRVFCWKRKSDAARIVLVLDVTQAEDSKCTQTPPEDLRKGWCWIASLDRPFNLECAQRLLTDTPFLERLPLFDLQNRQGQVVPYHKILRFSSKRHIREKADKKAATPKAGIRITDVNMLL